MRPGCSRVFPAPGLEGGGVGAREDGAALCFSHNSLIFSYHLFLFHESVKAV